MLKFSVKFLLFSLLLAGTLSGQSRDQNYPTGVDGPEISGSIKARDLGDSRLTSYFYAFDGAQGDIFVNVAATNFTGDVDIFTRDALRPLTKMVIYGNARQQVETGRVVYLRKPERLILRVQGRTPNDDPADFRIKFAGSFLAVKETAAVEEPTIARESKPERGTVNSVGTIVVPVAKLTPVPVSPAERISATSDSAPKESPNAAKTTKTTDTPPIAKRSEVVVKSSIKNPVAVKGPLPPAPAKIAPPVKAAPTLDPLASINLRIQLKSGSEVVRPMNEVLRFSVDKGILTVILKTGSISRYSIIDVGRVTIE